MTTGQKIGELAKEKGINLHKLAETTDISYNTIYSIVKRKSDKIDFENVRKIALALGVHPIEIYGDDALELIEYGMDLLHAGFEASRQTQAAFERGALVETSFDNVYSEQASALKRRVDTAYSMLNDEGKLKAVERIEELAEIPKYQRTETV